MCAVVYHLLILLHPTPLSMGIGSTSFELSVITSGLTELPCSAAVLFLRCCLDHLVAFFSLAGISLSFVLKSCIVVKVYKD